MLKVYAHTLRAPEILHYMRSSLTSCSEHRMNLLLGKVLLTSQMTDKVHMTTEAGISLRQKSLELISSILRLRLPTWKARAAVCAMASSKVTGMSLLTQSQGLRCSMTESPKCGDQHPVQIRQFYGIL